MTFFIGLAVVLGLALVYYAYMRGGTAGLLVVLRWGLGLAAGLAALAAGFGRQFGMAGVLGVVAYSILVRGRLGRWNLNPSIPGANNVSEVRSRYFRMALDHESGQVAGKVVFGAFRGRDMDTLGEQDTRELLAEVAGDPDSLSLLETYLDASRAGWREYFEETYGDTYGRGEGAGGSADHLGDITTEAQALEVLGLKKGATEEEIRAAYHRLIKAVHPDQGGSSALAARINQAKDLLLKKR